MRRKLLVGSLVAAVGLVGLTSQLHAAPPSPDSKIDLTPQSFPRLHSLIRPQDHEWRHLNVHWFTDVVAARKRAADEDKPIVVIYTGGAGYNEPLGIC
jgi:hypothetical protein